MISPDDETGRLYVWGYSKYDGEVDSDCLYTTRSRAMEAAEQDLMAETKVVDFLKNPHWSAPHPVHQYCVLKYKGGSTGFTVYRQEVL